MIHTLKYVKGALGKGFIHEDKGHTEIVGYSNADWAGTCTDRCSTSRYCIFIGGNLIFLKSKKQNGLQGLVLRQSIMPWHPPHASLSSLSNSLKSFNLERSDI